jgi:hypothetical protein
VGADATSICSETFFLVRNANVCPLPPDQTFSNIGFSTLTLRKWCPCQLWFAGMVMVNGMCPPTQYITPLLIKRNDNAAGKKQLLL